MWDSRVREHMKRVTGLLTQSCRSKHLSPVTLNYHSTRFNPTKDAFAKKWSARQVLQDVILF